MKNFQLLLSIIISFIFIQSSFVDAKTIKRNEYLKYAREAAEDYWKNYDEDIKKWVDRIDLKYVFGYMPTGNPLSFADVSANLYKITGEQKYAQWARKVLVEYGNLRNYYPADFWKNKPGFEKGVPPLPDFFNAPQYIKAYKILKNTKFLSPADKAIITENIAISCDHQVRSQEWGAMNRGILRAEVFYLAAITIPEHPHAKTWAMVAQSIIDDCWRSWEIEDATHYNAIHYYSLVSLSDYLADKDLWKEAVTRYAMQFFTRLMAPWGMLPDYGDSYLYGNWNRWIAIFEYAATKYQDPEIKYAANRISQNLWNFQAQPKSMWLATIAMDCYHWADDKIVPKAPAGTSELVLDDAVGKKIIFRTGYEPNDTYLLVNYKDEGIAGFMSRDYLRRSIAIEEEKVTHGHADENDISLFMADGCVLLHDGGYRDFMPSGPFGAYRADYFHNRVVVRKDKIFKGQKKGQYRYATTDSVAVPGQNVYDFVRNSGAYRPVQTELIDFLATENFDYSRSRVTDQRMGYQHDRIVNWVKPLNVFVVFDVVKFLVDDFYTSVNFWHTRKILAQGENFFDTQYDSLQKNTSPTHKSLLIYFPEGDQNGRMIGHDPEKRYWQNEIAIHQTLSRWHDVGDVATFTTILIPHETGSDLDQLMQKIELIDVDRYPQATGVKIHDGGKEYYVCSKLDRMIDIHYQDRRPQYDYEHGKVQYGEFETDAQQLFAVLEKDMLKFTSVYCVKLTYKNQILFEQKPVDFGLQYTDGVDRPGIGKLRYWQDEIKIK